MSLLRAVLCRFESTDTPQSPGLTNLTNIRASASVVVMNLYQAKSQLSTLVDRAAAGEEIVIAKNGRPMAKLVPFRTSTVRRPGRSKGRIWISRNFDTPLPPDLLAAFNGGSRSE